MKNSRRIFLKSAAAAAAATAITSFNIVKAQIQPLVRLAGAAPVVRPDHAWMFLGIPMGYYEKLGFKGDYVPTAGSAAALQLVLAGSVEVANCGFLELIAAKQRQPDLPVHMVYSQERTSTYQIIVVAESPIKALSDFKGKSIGVASLSSGAVPFAKGLLKRAGVDVATVSILPVGTGPQALAALRGNQVDALCTFIGQIAAMELLGQEFRNFTAPIAGGGMVMTDKFVADNRELATRIYQGLILNQRIMLENPAAVTRAYWAQYGNPTGDRDKAMKDSIHYIKRTAEAFQQLNDPQPWGVYTDAEWKTINEYFGGEGGLIPSTAKLSQFYSSELSVEGNKVDLNLATAAIKAFAN